MLPVGGTIQILAVVAWAELCLYVSLLASHLILWLLRTIKLMAAAAAPGEGWRETVKGEGTWSQKPATTCSVHGCCMRAKDRNGDFFSYFEI